MLPENGGIIEGLGQKFSRLEWGFIDKTLSFEPKYMKDEECLEMGRAFIIKATNWTDARFCFGRNCTHNYVTEHRMNGWRKHRTVFGILEKLMMSYEMNYTILVAQYINQERIQSETKGADIDSSLRREQIWNKFAK